MKKSILILAMLVLGTMASYSQMIYNEEGELVEKELTKRELKNSMNNSTCACEVFLKSGESIIGNTSLYYLTYPPGVVGPGRNRPIKMIVQTFPDQELVRIKSSDIAQLKVLGSYETYTFIWSKFLIDADKLKGKNKHLSKLAARTFEEVPFEEDKHEKWMLLVERGRADLYMTAWGFCFDKGEIAPVVIENTNPDYYGVLEGRDETPIAIYKDNQYFLEVAPAFFGEHPIAEKIRNQEEGFNYGYDGNLERLFDLYNKDN